MTARLHVGGGGGRDVAAHARAHQQDRVLDLRRDGDQLLDSCTGIVHSAIIHRFHGETQLPHHGRHGGDLFTPGTALLAVREHLRNMDIKVSLLTINVKETPVRGR